MLDETKDREHLTQRLTALRDRCAEIRVKLPDNMPREKVPLYDGAIHGIIDGRLAEILTAILNDLVDSPHASIQVLREACYRAATAAADRGDILSAWCGLCAAVLMDPSRKENPLFFTDVLDSTPPEA